MSRPQKRRLYAKLNSFGWREGWQNIVVFYGPFLLMFLAALLVTTLARFLPAAYQTTGERLPETSIERDQREPN